MMSSSFRRRPRPSSASSALFSFRRSLPVFQARKDVLELVASSQVVVIVGETGSGKTTQIPQFLREAGYCRDSMRIAVTQPRRVAAITVARRVADEVGCHLGSIVGYSIRFEDVSSKETEIKFLTDGTLLREAMNDPLLSAYSVIVLDEAHERSLHTDILFGIVKRALESRRDLRVVVMSATLEADLFADYFNRCPILFIEGRTHPVDIMYTSEPEQDYVEGVVLAVTQLHLDNQFDGDMLVFLTGQDEIENVKSIFEKKSKLFPPDCLKLMVCPIYAALSPEEQLRVFESTPKDTRKVILSTNIAETSITIRGIRLVLDCGLVKARAFNPRTGIDILAVVPISKSAASQRTGRAGRESPGVCFRLYTQEDFEKLEEATIPEIRRTNLSSVILQMKAMGIEDVIGFDFMDRPSKDTPLGALDEKGAISELGRKMSAFPVDPKFAKCICVAAELGCVNEILIITSMLSVENIFFAPSGDKIRLDTAKKQFASFYGDHLTLLRVYNEYVRSKRDRHWCFKHCINFRSMLRVDDVRRQLRDFCQRNSISESSSTMVPEILCRCLSSGFFLNAAYRTPDGKYRTVLDNQNVSVHPSSVLFTRKLPDWIIYNELVLTTKRYIREVTSVDPAWLAELAPRFFTSTVQNPTSSSSAVSLKQNSHSEHRRIPPQVQNRLEAEMERVHKGGVRINSQAKERKGKEMRRPRHSISDRLVF